jgi:structure-specific endonuclease subunit SLX1
MASKFFVYILESSSKRSTYVGATTDPSRRLRQHNKELVGGAHATGIKVLSGDSWNMVCCISEFPTWNAALQFEWRLKQITRIIKPAISTVANKNVAPIEFRRLALEKLLKMDRPTTKAIPYSEWPNGIGPIVTLME